MTRGQTTKKEKREKSLPGIKIAMKQSLVDASRSTREKFDTRRSRKPMQINENNIVYLVVEVCVSSLRLNTHALEQTMRLETKKKKIFQLVGIKNPADRTLFHWDMTDIPGGRNERDRHTDKARQGSPCRSSSSRKNRANSVTALAEHPSKPRASGSSIIQLNHLPRSVTLSSLFD